MITREEVLKNIETNKKIRRKTNDPTRKTKFFNSWRAIKFSEKGKKAGCSEEWNNYESFRDDMFSTWKDGMIICRIDKNKPFSKENCLWIEKSDQLQHHLIRFEYCGIEKTLKEWCVELDLNYTGVRQRFFKGKNYTKEEVLFGKEKSKKAKISDISSLSPKRIRTKASKMVSSYKNKDKKRNLKTDITSDWVIENILSKECSYCGTKEGIGCDRKKNHEGHTKENCIPCCFRCNTIRGNFFDVEEMKKIGEFLKTEIYKKREGFVSIDWTNKQSRISKFFTVHEATFLPSWNVYHEPSEEEKESIKKWAEKMDIVREFLQAPIIIHCWIRPTIVSCFDPEYNGKNYNDFVGGAKNSSHIDGSATDFHVSGLKQKCEKIRENLLPKLEEFEIRMEDNDGDWVHLDGREVSSSRFFKV
jgi:hypothetical protein